MRPLSQDLRLRIVAARERGEGTGEVCRRFGVSRKSVERFWKQHCLTGACAPKKIGGYLPPYSPDLNPTELAFAKLKAHLRQAAARTLKDLLAAVAAALKTFSSRHCQGFFHHAQYASI